MSETPPAPPVAAGWYPDATNPSVQRYWDGAAWTDHTAPSGTVAAPATMATKTKLLIAGGVVAGLIIVSGIGAAASSFRPPTVSSSDSQTQEPVEVTPSAAPTPEAPTEPVYDLAGFTDDATRDLADFEKDLNDMVVTVDEGGFWRLLSNSFELSFNLGQLQAATAPPSVEAEWTAGLAALEASITGIDDSISSDDAATIKAAIESSRAQVVSLRGIVAAAT